MAREAGFSVRACGKSDLVLDFVAGLYCHIEPAVHRMRIRHLQTFCDLARTLNFTRTASRLHYAQSSVVEQLDALERHFGTRLFSRDGRKLALTAQGEQLLPDAQAILDLAEQARARLRGTPAAPLPLRVMAPETLCARRLPRLVGEYHAWNPQAAVEVLPASRSTLARAVADGVADFAFMLGVPGKEPELAGSADVARCVVGQEPLLLVAAAGHPLATGAASLELARQFPLYATEQGCAFRAASDAVLEPLGIRPALVSGSVAALVEAVAATRALALLPEMAVEDALGQGRLAVLPLPDPAWPPVPVLMDWRRGSAPHLDRFAELALAMAASSGP
jgi:DNA-binding transcriptional LysR family regulator